jgi:phage gpG-like protein
MSVTVTITGLNDVQDFIHKVPASMMDRLNRIIKDAALVCMDHSKRNSPVITGRYRSSLHIETEKASKYNYNDDEGRSFDGSFSEEAGQDEIFVGTNVEYSDKVESKHRTMDEARIQAQFYLTTKLHELTR